MSFSKRSDDSVLTPNLVLERRILTALKLAASKIMSLVSSFIPESFPPIIPASANGVSPLVISKSELFNSRIDSSNKTNFSLSLALLIIICNLFLFEIFSASKACIGCPSSNIT